VSSTGGAGDVKACVTSAPNSLNPAGNGARTFHTDETVSAAFESENERRKKAAIQMGAAILLEGKQKKRTERIEG